MCSNIELFSDVMKCLKFLVDATVALNDTDCLFTQRITSNVFLRTIEPVKNSQEYHKDSSDLYQYKKGGFGKPIERYHQVFKKLKSSRLKSETKQKLCKINPDAFLKSFLNDFPVVHLNIRRLDYKFSEDSFENNLNSAYQLSVIFKIDFLSLMHLFFVAKQYFSIKNRSDLVNNKNTIQEISESETKISKFTDAAIQTENLEALTEEPDTIEDNKEIFIIKTEPSEDVILMECEDMIESAQPVSTGQDILSQIINSQKQNDHLNSKFDDNFKIPDLPPPRDVSLDSFPEKRKPIDNIENDQPNKKSNNQVSNNNPNDENKMIEKRFIKFVPPFNPGFKDQTVPNIYFTQCGTIIINGPQKKDSKSTEIEPSQTRTPLKQSQVSTQRQPSQRVSKRRSDMRIGLSKSQKLKTHLHKKFDS